jgi:tetratricopeptide (TPR) repeat protein
MKCPKCGSELPEHALFCEKCAAEIKIVPEYEARLEEQISISLENVASVVEEEKGPAVPISSAAEVLQQAEEEEAARQEEQVIPAVAAADAESAALQGETMISPASFSQELKEALDVPSVSDEERQRQKEEAREKRRKRYISRRRYVKFMMVFMVGAFAATIVLVLFYVLKLYPGTHTQSYYVGRAYQFASEGKYQKAADEIDKAVEICDKEEQSDSNGEQTVATLYLLKSQYLQKAGEKDLALGAASMALEDPNSTEDEEISAYGRMITIYASYEEYDKIAMLLSTCSRQQVVDSYLQYTLFDPEFSAEEGTYDEGFTLQLSDQGEGSIFYTMDGSEPTTDSLLYTEPIKLTEGTFTISAVYVNHFNLSSNVVTKTYTIVSPGSGETQQN